MGGTIQPEEPFRQDFCRNDLPFRRDMHRYADSPLLALLHRYGRITRNRQEIDLARVVVSRPVKQINIFGIRFHRLADCLPVL